MSTPRPESTARRHPRHAPSRCCWHRGSRHGIWPVRRTHQVLRSADLTLRPREVVGLVGENGSGKSTLLKVLVGALRPDAGTVTVAGTLGYCPQEPIGYERLTCRGCSAWAGCSRSGCSPPDCSARPRQ